LAPIGQPAVLQHPFNWKRASMAAALCYGVRGGGAGLAFHLQPGNYNTDSLIQVLGELRRFLGGEKAHAAVGRAAGPSQPCHAAWLNRQRSCWWSNACRPTRPSSTRWRACGHG
jgi:hypothetical protein